MDVDSSEREEKNLKFHIHNSILAACTYRNNLV